MKTALISSLSWIAKIIRTFRRQLRQALLTKVRRLTSHSSSVANPMIFLVDLGLFELVNSLFTTLGHVIAFCVHRQAHHRPKKLNNFIWWVVMHWNEGHNVGFKPVYGVSIFRLLKSPIFCHFGLVTLHSSFTNHLSFHELLCLWCSRHAIYMFTM